MRDNQATSAKQLSFTLEEYRQRLERTRRAMERRDIEVLLVHNPASINYLSGYENLHMYDNECVVIPLGVDPTLLLPSSELLRAELTSWCDQQRGFVKWQDEPGESLAAILREHGLDRARIGVEKKVARAAGLSVHVYETLRAALPAATFVDGSGLMETVKAIKSPAEIEYHRQAARITDLGHRAAIAAAGTSKTDSDVAAAAYAAMIAAGSEYMSIPCIVNAGPLGSYPHATHGRVTMNRGDTLQLELGASVQRYSSPSMRTVSLGEPGADVRRAADAVVRAVETLHSAMRPGVTFEEAHRAAATAAAFAAIPDAEPFVYAYGVGVGFPPHWGDYTARVRAGDQTHFEPGMVFHTPCGLTVRDRFGIMFSDTVLITGTGSERLTTTERRLVIR